MMTPKMSAVRKPSKAKPGMSLSASITSRAFKITEKSPRVRKESGKVKSFRTGLRTVFINPRTTATISGALAP